MEIQVNKNGVIKCIIYNIGLKKLSICSIHCENAKAHFYTNLGKLKMKVMINSIRYVHLKNIDISQIKKTEI